MFPIRDHNPSRRTPYVTWALIAINVVVFLSYYPVMSGDDYRLAAFWNDWAMVPREVAYGHGFHTVFTSMFLHGGWMHLIGNMLFLWIFGDNMEDSFGHVWFLAFYLLCGMMADVVHVWSAPNSNVPVVGASGAIAGVLGGYLLLFPKARVDIVVIFVIFFKTFPLSAWIVLCYWIGMQVLSGLATPAGGSGIAYWAHAGGFVAGIFITLPYWVRNGGTKFWKATDGHPGHPPTNTPDRLTSIPIVRRRK